MAEPKRKRSSQSNSGESPNEHPQPDGEIEAASALENWKALIAGVSDEMDADIIGVVTQMYFRADEKVLAACRSRTNKRRNILLVLSTPGGSADEAYRIARHLRRAYCQPSAGSRLGERGQLILYVHDFCKSAGTILALGADRIVMSQSAELGPIDVQLRKEDEVGERTSGLTPHQALETLQVEAGQHFRRFFRQMRFEASLQFSTKMSADLAARMTAGLLEPVYAQLDPIRLGEVERFVRIASEYGDRLKTSNVKEGTIEKLVSGYPSHEFVIDREEARELFEHVDVPSDGLEAIGAMITSNLHPTQENPEGYVGYLNEDNDAATDQRDDKGKSVTSPGEGYGSLRPDPASEPTTSVN